MKELSTILMGVIASLCMAGVGRIALAMQDSGTVTLNGGTSRLFHVDTSGEVGFTVETLTKEEIETIKRADKEFAEAQAKHLAATLGVRHNHGQTVRGSWGYESCGVIDTDVELRGNYALITRTQNTSSCPVMN